MLVNDLVEIRGRNPEGCNDGALRRGEKGLHFGVRAPGDHVEAL